MALEDYQDENGQYTKPNPRSVKIAYGVMFGIGFLFWLGVILLIKHC